MADPRESFGKRMGFDKSPATIQFEDWNTSTRNRLWNTLHSHYVINSRNGWDYSSISEMIDNGLARGVAWSMYDEVFKLPRSSLAPEPWNFIIAFEKMICVSEPWWKVAEVLEFFVEWSGQRFRGFYVVRPDLDESLNKVLEQELVGWRFVDLKLVPITSPMEIAEVTAAVHSSHGPVSAHFEKALSLLAEKQETNFSTAVHEAVAGVEAAAKFVTGKNSDVLSSMLQTLAAKHGTHTALAEVFKKMYGWASDGGIRHGKKETDSPVDRDLARCMLVMCSAFANLLVSSKAT